ncbi:MAG: hypothetical protein KUG58_07660 [Marinosulfonomonas sp.]|nr:hypothetical protein [Marinosulfonomonas sp.]
MIKKILLKSIDEHSRLTLSGDIEGLLGYYKTVFPVFVRGEAKLINSRDELRAALNAASARSRAAGVTRIEGRLIKAHKISDRRYRCLVEWDYHTPKYSAPQTTAVMFFCSFDGSKIKVEMVEYKKIAFVPLSESSDPPRKKPKKNSTNRPDYLH